MLTASEAEVSGLLGLHPTENDSIATRRPKQEVKVSTRMKDSLEYLGHARANVASVDSDELHIPRTYPEAMWRSDIWFELMVKEIQTMRDKGVYLLVPRPLNKNVVKCHWVYALKFDDAGNITSHKARIITKGFTQVFGEDYNEMYASVGHLESVCLICTVAASLGLHLWQVNFGLAFLNSNNTFALYMEQPPGFEEGGKDNVWLLLKTLYGTMQGAHDWARNLDCTYESPGYYALKADPQIQS
jgi:hypothetical protein